MPNEDEHLHTAQNEQGLIRWPGKDRGLFALIRSPSTYPCAFTPGVPVRWADVGSVIPSDVVTPGGKIQGYRGSQFFWPSPAIIPAPFHQVNETALRDTLLVNRKLARVLDALLMVQGPGIAEASLMLKGVGGTPMQSLTLGAFLLTYKLGDLVGILLRRKFYHLDRLNGGMYVLPIFITGLSIPLEAFLALDPTLSPIAHEILDAFTIVVDVAEPIVDAMSDALRENSADNSQS